MMDDDKVEVTQNHQSISIKAAEQLTTTINTSPQIPSLTPRWLLHLLPWINVESGMYRVNQIKYLTEIQKLVLPPNKKLDLKTDYYFLSDLLKSIPLFKAIPDEFIKEILKGLYQKAVEAGDIIVKQGEKGNKFYIVTDGQFDVSVEGKDGKSSIIKSLVSGDYFGEMALLEEAPRQATIIAATKGSLICLNKETFYKIVSSPELKKELDEVFQTRKKELQLSSHYGEVQIPIISGHSGEPIIPHGYSDYIEHPTEIHLSLIQTIIGIHTRINDLYTTVAYNQLDQQLKVAIENIREREEWEIINNKEFGLLQNISSNMVISPKFGFPAPDDLDELLALVWKKPTFFLAHPKAIAAFAQQCNQQKIPVSTKEILGQNFLAWRGIALIPSDKLIINNNNGRLTTDILLIRAGEKNQGVIALHKKNINDNDYKIPSLSIQPMGINDNSISNYLITKYFAVAILVPDAIGMLKGVEIDHYYGQSS